jgi:hypothetical protein
MAGNANSGRKAEKPFRDALRMQLKEAGDDHKALRMIAAKLIDMAASGDMQAIKELADRTDGKSVQQVDAEVTVRSIEDLIEQLDTDASPAA